MSIQTSIEHKLRTALTPEHLEVINESHMHNVPPGSESHFKVIIAAAAFEGQSLVTRHRKVNAILAAELQGTVHAVALHTLTPEEWARQNGNVHQSPPCHGGGANGRKKAG